MNEAAAILIKCMQEELNYHAQMEALLESKLDAMKGYNMASLEALGLAERRLVETERLRGTKRNRAVLRLTKLYYPQLRGRLATASEIAAKLEPGQRTPLLNLVEQLRVSTGKVQRLHRINAAVTRKLMGHVDSIFKVVAQAGVQIGLYGREGRKPELEQRRLIDATA